MKTILATVDFSETSNNAAHYAAALCKSLSSKLILLHAYHVPVTMPEHGYIPAIMDMKGDSEVQMKKLVKQLRSKFKYLDIHPELKMGLASEIIEETAKAKNAELIVMGINGKSGFIKKHMIGTVTTHVAKTSCIPVLIVPTNTKFTKIKNIAFACDLDKVLEKNTAILKVKQFCSLFRSKLELINVIKPGEKMSVEKAETGNYIEGKLDLTNHNAFFVYNKEVYRGLLDYISYYAPDLVIMSPKKHGFFHDLFIGSNTDKLAFYSPVPILTVH